MFLVFLFWLANYFFVDWGKEFRVMCVCSCVGVESILAFQTLILRGKKLRLVECLMLMMGFVVRCRCCV